MTLLQNVKNTFFFAFLMILWLFFCICREVRGVRARLWQESKEHAWPTEVWST